MELFLANSEMSTAPNGESAGNNMNRPEQSCEKAYKGVRRRRWGKWVSEIRVPGTRERLWLGSYSTPEAAAAAHDTAVFFLRGPRCSSGLNFPELTANLEWADLSPSSVQTAASNSGMAVDARLAVRPPEPSAGAPEVVSAESGANGSTGNRSVDFVEEICLDDVEFYISD